MLTFFDFIITLYSMHNPYYYLIDEKNEIQRGYIIWGHSTSKSTVKIQIKDCSSQQSTLNQYSTIQLYISDMN